MPNEVTHLTLAGNTVSFRNPEGLYPVNQYQSLVLATVTEFAALLVAHRRGRGIADVSAWEPCCGGGPVAVTLKRLGLGYVRASDINEAALETCRANAVRNGVTLDRVTRVDMLDDGEDTRFDIIACNPPCGVHAQRGAAGATSMEVAVSGGAGGMEPTRALLTQSLARLTTGGALLFVVVSTGDVRSVAQQLNDLFPGRWRAFPATPIAAPYAPLGDPKVEEPFDSAAGFTPLVWQRGDGWLWRLTWVVEATLGGDFISPVAGRPARPGFPLCPLGHEVSRDAALRDLIDRVSDDGFWLS